MKVKERNGKCVFFFLATDDASTGNTQTMNKAIVPLICWDSRDDYLVMAMLNCSFNIVKPNVLSL